MNEQVTPATAQQAIELSNPATGAAERRSRPPRRPMSTSRRRLETPEIPGHHLHWFKEDNVPLALDAYYEFVDKNEVSMNQLNVSLSEVSHGTDLGSRVSLIADKSESGSPVRAYLMKIKEEYWLEDQKEVEAVNMRVMSAVFGEEAQVGIGGVAKPREALTYIDKERTALYNRATRKAVVRKRSR